VFYIIDEIMLLMLKLVSNKIDTYLTSLWRHQRYLFSVFREILRGLMNFFYFGWSGVYFIFILHLYITVTCRHTIIFYGKDCFSNIKTSSKRLEYFHQRYLFSVFREILPAIFGRFSKTLSTSAVVHQKNILPDY
jgi:hypothetical protein